MADAFEEELVSHMPKLRAFACRLTRNADSAEDVVQDAMVKALGARDRFIAGTNMLAWLYTIARNDFYTKSRRAKRSVALPDEIAFALPVGPSQHHVVELKEVMSVIALLPRVQAEALLMIAEGESYEDAAEDAMVAVGTLKSRASRARDAVSHYFTGGHYGEIAEARSFT